MCGRCDPRWIPTAVRLPTRKEANYKNGLLGAYPYPVKWQETPGPTDIVVEQLEFEGGEWWRMYGEEKPVENVLAWMPMPEYHMPTRPGASSWTALFQQLKDLRHRRNELMMALAVFGWGTFFIFIIYAALRHVGQAE